MKNGLFFLLILLFSCQTQPTQQNIDKYVGDFLKSNGLDKRTTFFETTLKDGKISGIGQDDIQIDAFKTFMAEADSDIVIEMESIGTNIAYIRNSVSNSRSEPKHSAELSTQYLMGQKVNIIKQEGDWYYIQGPDNYLSWIDGGGILLEKNVNQKWLKADKFIVQVNETVANQDNEKKAIATDLVFGNLLGKISTNHYISPDGTNLYLNDDDIFQKNHGGEIVQVIQKAKSLMGRPYLWGGTSTKGMDCSGFTRTAFMNADYLLGRDASLQVKEGKAVDIENRNNWKEGDLLFFGTIRDDGSHRITHVAIHLENGDMIHASERVRIESINPESNLYNKDRDNSLLQVRRIFN